MNEIINALKEAALKRADNFQTFYVRKFPDESYFKEIVMMGSHSYCLIQTKRRLVKEKMKIDPVNDPSVVETPSAIARDYLRHVYQRGPRGTKAQMIKVEGLPPVPSYAKPGKFAHGSYIDIRSAYWSIMKIIGWDLDYNPGLWISPGRPPADFPFPDHKVARNCLVSAGRMGSIDPETQKPRGIPMYDPRKLPGDPYSEVIRGSELKNNQLPRLIHDLLNSIAAQAIEVGAVYVNNDGFIGPTPNITDRIIGVIRDWGLDYSIKGEGGGQVKASGTYEVGIAKTKQFEAVHDPISISHVYPPDYANWLQTEFSFFAAKGNPL
jgi:hypothetical protein